MMRSDGEGAFRGDDHSNSSASARSRASESESGRRREPRGVEADHDEDVEELDTPPAAQPGRGGGRAWHRKRKSPTAKEAVGDDELKVAEGSDLGEESEPRQPTSRPQPQPQPQRPRLLLPQPQATTGGRIGPPPDADPAKPPPFNLDDDALAVFSGPFFQPYEHLREARNSVLRGNTIRSVLLRCFCTKEGVDPLGQLSTEVGASNKSVHEYYGTADLATKQQFAATRMKARYGCDFHEAEIPNAEIVAALLPLLRVESDADDRGDIAKRTIDLALLNPLRVGGEEGTETFLVPDKIYVRDCMRFIFGLFHEDGSATPQKPRRPPNKDYSAALVGSPGVGKSILFFLAALHQAKSSAIVFYRKSRKGPVSVFVMSPSRSSSSGGPSPSAVRVWFTRNLTLNLAPGRGLAGVNADLIGCGVVDTKVCYTFVDGPILPKGQVATDTLDTLDGNYDYFCTSGGFSGFAQEQDENRLWVLDGWTENEAVLALGMLGKSEEDAGRAYALCGGSIRNMILATRDATSVRRDLDGLVTKMSAGSEDLMVTSMERSDDPKHPDRLRTMFELRENSDEESRRKRMMAYQRVDSRYAFKYLCTKIEMGRFFTAYRLAETRSLWAGQGVFFEHIVHQWAENNKESNEIRSFSGVCWSSGSIEECIEQLSSPDVYWIPSKQNFPNIDSALVHNRTLFAFQMTISGTHKFDRVTFERNVVDKVREKCQLHHVVLVFVHPRAVVFRIPSNLPTSRPFMRLRSRVRFLASTLASRVGADAWAGAALEKPAFECRAFGVDTRSEVDMSNSLTALFRVL